MRVTILGCGPSGGLPGVSYGWGRCDPENERNRRLRPSILVEHGAATVLVDTSPDLRAQLLNATVRHLDAVLYTHYHADHLHGIDDLRPINRLLNAPLDCYADQDTLRVIRERFAYAFEPLAEGAAFYYKPTLLPHEIHDQSRIAINGMDITAFDQDHGFCRTLGFKFGDSVAYSTDLVNLPEPAFDVLAGVKLWIIGVLTEDPAPTHAHVAKALEWIDRVRPERAVLTHLGANLDYGRLAAMLPDGVEPAHDGMILDWPDTEQAS